MGVNFNEGGRWLTFTWQPGRIVYAAVWNPFSKRWHRAFKGAARWHRA